MDSIESFHSFSPLLALCGFLFSLATYFWIFRSSVLEEKSFEQSESKNMKDFADLIYSGSLTFLKKEYSILLFILAIVTLVLSAQFGHQSALAYLIGALSSMFCGFIGIKTATMANLKTAQASQAQNKSKAFSLSFHAGSVMGMTVASLGILGIFICHHYFTHTNLEALASYAMGASSIALFSRVGGGIYTKAADVGADLVSKFELGINEDDPRNPATIVDHVGDNVGDTAGVGADIFESYCGSLIAAMFIGSTLPEVQQAAVLLPLIAATIGLIGSVTAISLMGLFKNFGLSTALRIAPFVALAILFIGSYYAILEMNFDDIFSHPLGPFYAMICGAFIGLFIGISSEYYTSPDSPTVKRIAYASKTGEATNILTGLAMGMYSCIIPVLLICLGVYTSFHFAGLYGIAMAAVGMLSTIGITLTIDAQRPIVDNSEGIIQATQTDQKNPQVTDQLTGVVGKTATIGKGFAIGSAALTALALFSAYATATGLEQMSLVDPKVVIGLFLGGVLPFFVAANTINAVGNAAQKMVHELRRHFRQNPDILKTKTQGHHAKSDKCIKIATIASLRQMIKPGLVAILVPVLVGHFLGKEALAGVLIGVSVCGVIMGIFLANTGGAWDSAKKTIEAGKIIGEQKGSKAHDASIVGDMVGDPFKDTAGPALNILVKLVAIVALVMAPILS